IENTLAADPRIEAIATPLRPEVATIVGLHRPGEDMQVHGVFLVKDPAQVAAIVRDANTKLSGSQQIRGWTIWPEDEFPTTPTQKVKKRLVIEELLNMGRVDQAKAATSERTVTRELTEVETLIAQAANVPPAAVHPGATLSADLGLDSLGRVDLLGAIEEELGAYTAAAADDVFGNKLNGFASSILANAFPLAREGAIRRSLELLGARLDRHFSVLIYPEGKLTIGGPMQPFKSGTGLIAVEGATPVVPMKLKIGKVSVLDHLDRKWEASRSNGWRGNVEVVFGDPIYFPAGTPAGEATAKLQAAVAAL